MVSGKLSKVNVSKDFEINLINPTFAAINYQTNPMKKLLLATMAMLLFACSGDDSTGQNVAGACVFVGDVTLTTQAEVDAFAAKNYCTVDGDIIIGTTIGLDKSDVFNLVGLNNLAEVTGIITISYTKDLVSLDGLNNLKVVGNYIKIIGNDKLSGLTPLSSLRNIGADNYGGIWVEENPNLVNLEGFEGVTFLSGLIISNNIALQNLQGLNNVKKINTLEVSYNNMLTSLNGFDKLEHCGNLNLYGTNLKSIEALHNLKKVNHLYFSNCGLTSLKGLENLKTILSVNLLGMNDLTSLEGLENLNTVSYIWLYSNRNLTSIEALSGVSAVITDPLWQTGIHFSYNEKLKSLNGLQNITEFEGIIFINDNKALTDFCALRESMLYPGFNAEINIYSNGFSVSELGLRNGTCKP